ncbi:putative internal virion protein B [Erwinia phage pEp_SNUABM_10]|uniref:Internal virion protein gp14 n=1 Tax=Erwinia phage pEp_SNUABM_09 TaxID=2601644 RepID=A0A5J6DAE4_9CAUD|nr:putative internal virion protein B [Erwinia phage pEp_SNUABM_09]QOC57613.1 putative internal virion protein B [Erwinia phage pEp_SNUABM_03]QOC57668.1 putative internal virion protein B [Erwinia phage pEp_SNUABM_04]QOC57718.1 putative internal virion protein B [Erwinia phage pEp_SNUABM_10]QOC57771.1 Internal virion protein C [Erwinia phage pEp_SNUABM_11]
MCWMVAIPIAMAAGQQMMSGAQNNAAQAASTDQQRRQALEMVKKLRYDDADARMEGLDTLDTARSELTASSMQKVRSMGTVRAAIGEGALEGASMDRVLRVTEGDFIRDQNNVTDNYKRDYAKIFTGRIGARASTVAQIEQMQKSEPRVKGAFEQIIDPLGIGIGKLYDLTDIGGKKLYGDKVKAKVARDSKQ